MIPIPPSIHTDKNVCQEADASMASEAIFILPSVPFLNPTGHGSHDASSRWVWDSVVLAQIAHQLIISDIYWYAIGSRNSVAVGTPIYVISKRSCLAILSPSSSLWEPSKYGSLISHFHPMVVLGFSQYVRITISRESWNSSRHFCTYHAYSKAEVGSWIEHGPTITRIRQSFQWIIERIAFLQIFIWLIHCWESGNSWISESGDGTNQIFWIDILKNYIKNWTLKKEKSA